MALDNRFKKVVELNTIYETRGTVYRDTASLNPYIYVKGGTVNIYGSSSLTPPESLADMELNEEDTGIYGLTRIDIVPTYICVTQNTGTSEEIIINSVSLEELKKL